VALLVQLVVVGTGSWLIESSGLEQDTRVWGYLSAVVLATVLYASWPLLVTLVCAVAGSVAGTAAGTRRAALIGAVVAGAWAVFVIAVGAQTALTARVEGDVVFGLLLVGASLLALWPLARTLTRS
jgi:hypothetical protein